MESTPASHASGANSTAGRSAGVAAEPERTDQVVDVRASQIEPPCRRGDVVARRLQRVAEKLGLKATRFFLEGERRGVLRSERFGRGEEVRRLHLGEVLRGGADRAGLHDVPELAHVAPEA